MGQDFAADEGEGHGPRGEGSIVTRRTLLGAAAAAGAASLISPPSGLARPGGVPSPVCARWVGELVGRSARILAPRAFALVGVQWSGAPGAHIDLRAQAPDGRWSPWVTASILGHDGDGRLTGDQRFGEPLWTGPAVAVELRSDRTAHDVRLHFVSVRAAPGAEAAAGLPLAAPRLDAGPGQPPIIARRAWAAGAAEPRHAPEYGTVKLAFVHHTVNPNGYGAAEVPAMLRAIFDYHVYVRGFWDIAYNFIVDAYGRIWEARAGGVDMAVIGAQAGGYNAESTGVAMLGDFMSVVPAARAVAALERLLAWKLSLHGLPSYGRVTVVVDPAGAVYTPFAPGAHVSLPRVAGHRDGCTTDCPGNALYDELPSLRPRITALAGTPATLSLVGPPAALLPGAQATIAGRLESLSGAPLAGAPIELQQLAAGGAGAVTIAATTTASDGSWSFTQAVERNTVLRALHRPYPASVSDWALVAVAPVIALQLQSASPLVVSGTITPPLRQVTVDVYQAAGSRARPLASRRVKVTGGRFRSRLPVRRPGSYVVIARSAPTARMAGGTSPPLSVSVP
jgi:hypothetical protein